MSQSSTNVASVNIDLSDENFSATPRLIVSVRGTDCSAASSYTATITSVDNSGASVYIMRVDSSDAWVESVYLDWIAWEPSETSLLSTEGSTTVSFTSSDASVHNISVTFDDADFIVSQPVILVSVQQTLPVVSEASDVYYYLTNTYNNEYTGFELYLQLQNADTSNAQTIDLTVTYWAFERIVLESSVSDNVTNTLITGTLLDELQQVWKENYSQSFVAFNVNNSDDLSYIDVALHLGPIDQGAEFVSKFTTQLNSDYTWYTNQNDLEYVKRVYDPTIDERVAGNYFPAASQSYMMGSDDEYRFSTIVDQAHGVGSHENGAFELMLHRRCLSDDSRGVGEVLNETTHIEPKLWMVFDEPDSVTKQNRRLFNLQQFDPINFWQLTTDSISEWSALYKTSFNAMGSSYNDSGLPKNVHLQQLRYVYSGSEYNNGLVMQLQHLFESNENSKYSVNETVDLSELLSEDILTISEATEMTLTANLPLSDLNRLPWNIEGENGKVKRVNTGKEIERKLSELNGLTDSYSVTMNPRDIRTFVINEDVSKVKRRGRSRNPKISMRSRRQPI